MQDKHLFNSAKRNPWGWRLPPVLLPAVLAAVLLLEAGYAPTQVKSLVQGLRPKALTLTPHVDYLNTHYSFAG